MSENNSNDRMDMLSKTVTKTLSQVCTLGNNPSAYYEIEVRGVSETKDGSRTIINFAGCTDYQKRQIVNALREKGSFEAFSEEELQEVANINVTYGFPTEWITSARGAFVPEKGEVVKALFKKHQTEDEDGNTILIDVIDKITPIASKHAQSVSVDDIFGGVELDVEEESTPDAVAKTVIK